MIDNVGFAGVYPQLKFIRETSVDYDWNLNLDLSLIF